MQRAWSTITRRRDATLPAAAVVVVFLFGAVASSFTPFSRPIEVATLVPVGIVVAIAVSRGWHHRRLEEPVRPHGAVRTATVLVWIVLIALAAGLAYAHYQSQPRTVYPTLSSLASTVFSEVPGARAVAFGLWTWLGWYLLDR